MDSQPPSGISSEEIAHWVGENWKPIATGIVAAAKETHLTLPLVVRLEGNNVEAGRKTLAESGLTISTGESMAEAAQKVVAEVAA